MLFGVLGREGGFQLVCQYVSWGAVSIGDYNSNFSMRNHKGVSHLCRHLLDLLLYF